MAGLREIIENKLADAAHKSAHSFLEQLLDDAGAWESDFVKAARHHAVTVYKPALSSANELWDVCEDKYGRGIDGYRDEIASALEAWFDDHEELQDEVDRLVRRAWRMTVLRPLRAAAGAAAPLQEAGDRPSGGTDARGKKQAPREPAQAGAS